MVRISNRRWPIHSFHITLDLAAINVWIVYKEITKNNIPKRVLLLQFTSWVLHGQKEQQKENRFQKKYLIDDMVNIL